METVMLSGSRHISGLPPSVRERLTELVEQGLKFLVGDAKGADRAFQSALARLNYPEVRVFTSLPEARVNLGGWPVQLVESGLRTKSAAMHTVKDRHMVRLADRGLVLWDCTSTGSLANVIDLVETRKACHMWTHHDELLVAVDSPGQLVAILDSYPGPATAARQRLATFHNREKRQGLAESESLF